MQHARERRAGQQPAEVDEDDHRGQDGGLEQGLRRGRRRSEPRAREHGGDRHVRFGVGGRQQQPASDRRGGAGPPKRRPAGQGGGGGGGGLPRERRRPRDPDRQERDVGRRGGRQHRR